MTKEGTEDSLFVLPEAPVPAAGYVGIGDLEVNKNDRTDGAKSNDDLNSLSDCTSNINSEDIAKIHRQGINIYDDKNIATLNVPSKIDTTTDAGNWRREGNICLQKTGNLQNSFPSFRHYLHNTILRMCLCHYFSCF